MPHDVSAGTLTVERLKWLLDYDRETGLFRWKNRDNRPDLIGRVAGCVTKAHGYRIIRIDGFLYKGGRLAWLYCTGEWPSEFIDHIDGRRDNDAFANLRQATSQQNNSNKHTVYASSGFKGVYFVQRENKFIARLVKDRRCIYLGTFNNSVDAALAYNAGAVEHFGEFAKLNQV